MFILLHFCCARLAILYHIIQIFVNIYVYMSIDIANCMPVDNLVKVCEANFTSSFICDAKLRLFNACERGPEIKSVPSGGIVFKTQRGPQSTVNNITDIITLLQEEGVDMPTLAAANLNLLPPVTLDDIDVAGLVRTVKFLSSEVAELSNKMRIQQVVMDNLRGSVERNRNRNYKQKNNTYAAALADTPSMPQQSSNGVVQPSETPSQGLMSVERQPQGGTGGSNKENPRDGAL